MATQGIVSVTENGKVRLKIVAGCDGYNARKLARKIRRRKTIPTLENAYRLAESVEFGSEDCLVVMNETGALYEGVGNPGPLYRETFNDPEFNPRWDHGIADHVVIVDMTPRH